MDLIDAETVRTVLTVIVVPLAIWAWKQWQGKRATKKVALKTVGSWESTVEKKNEQIQESERKFKQNDEQWSLRYQQLEEDYMRSRAIIRDQDARLERKDERIAHLELLCDSKGKPS